MVWRQIYINFATLSLYTRQLSGDLGMYSFILEEHKDTYGIFYKEVTGRPLQRVLLLSPAATTSGVKRKMQSAGMRLKEEPRIKKSKSEHKVSVLLHSYYKAGLFIIIIWCCYLSRDH